MRVRAPLKALDRMLGSTRLHPEREQIYTGMARWLARSARPVIVIDWSDLKRDGSWFLLRAAVPVSGRTLPLLDLIFPAGEQATSKAERHFLQRLKAILPAGVKPIMVTDAVFRIPWFRAVADMDWLWLDRLRHRTQVKPVDAADTPDQWLPCKVLYELASRTPRDLDLMDTARSQSWLCRMVAYGKPPKGRKKSRQNANRDIDLNPVRARMTDDPTQFAWSSCAALCGQRDDPLLSPHLAYMRLGSTRAERADAYRTLLSESLSDEDLQAIRAYLQQQRALGRDDFRTMVEAKTRRFAGVRPAHRPRHELSK